MDVHNDMITYIMHAGIYSAAQRQCRSHLLYEHVTFESIEQLSE